MSQNLQNFVKFQKFQLENLVDFEKCCKTHILLQKSEPIQPKTSNILPKVCQQPVTKSTPGSSPARRRRRPSSRSAAASSRRCSRRRPGASTRASATSELVKLAKFCKFLAGSFSAISKRNFARKYAFDSIFQAIQDVHTFAPLRSQNFSKNRFEKSAFFVKIQQNFANVAKFAKCCQISKFSAR